MGRHAIISDIHANIEALQAVLDDIEQNGVTRIICLGDVVGYGPDPLDCLRLIREKASTVILGNHELGLSEGGTRFNARARRAIEWTARKLQETPEGRELYEWAGALPTKHMEDGILYVHGSPVEATNQYLLPKLARTPAVLEPQFALFDRYCFCGHTHFPGVMEPGRRFEPPAEMLMNIFMLADDSKAIVNVGSVGQPRDRNTDACYVLFDGDSAVYRRVSYDVEKVAAKIRAIDLLDNSLGDRLVAGK